MRVTVDFLAGVFIGLSLRGSTMWKREGFATAAILP
jgi:hypothetical protein